MNFATKSLISSALLATALFAQAAPNSAENTQVQNAGAYTLDAQAVVRAGIDEYFSLWTNGQIQSASTVLHEDTALQYSLSIPEVHGTIDGRDSLANHVAAIAQLGTDWRFDDVALYATNDANVYFVQYTAYGKLLSTGESFSRPAIVVIQTNGRKVTRIQELSNPAIAEASVAGDAAAAKKLARFAK